MLVVLLLKLIVFKLVVLHSLFERLGYEPRVDEDIALELTTDLSRESTDL